MSDRDMFQLPPAWCWFVYVFEPRKKDLAGKPIDPDKQRYSMMLLWWKEDNPDLRDLKNRLVAGAKSGFGGPKGVKIALKDGDKDEDGSETNGYWYARVSSKFKPQVVAGNMTSIESPDEFYSGCYARVLSSVYTTSHPEGGKFVQLNLESIQRTGKGKALGGVSAVKAADHFGATTEEDEEGWDEWGSDESTTPTEDELW